MFRRLLSAAPGVALVLGCAAPAPDPQSTRVRAVSQAVVGGVDSGPEDDGVVQMLSTGPEGTQDVCTGTLVAPNLVLTAAHCVSRYVAEALCDCSMEGELVRGSDSACIMGDPHDPALTEVHVGRVADLDPAAHGLEILTLHPDSICANDIAFVVLASPLPDLPIYPLRLDAETHRGEPLRVVGYGINEDGEVKRKTRSGVRVEAVGPNERWSAQGASLPRTFALGPSVCQGDSGGPALTEAGAVTGVFSYMLGDCQDEEVRNLFTQVGVFKDFVLEAFDRAGATPWLEGEPRPGTVPSDAGSPPADPETPANDPPTDGGRSATETPLDEPRETPKGSGCASAPGTPSLPGYPWLAGTALLVGLARRAHRRERRR